MTSPLLHFPSGSAAISSAAVRAPNGAVSIHRNRHMVLSGTDHHHQRQARNVSRARMNFVAAASKNPIVVVDNYDSFTYNLCQYISDCGGEYIVFPNDAKTVDEIRAMKPSGVLVSPGPGCPEESGISLEIVETLGKENIPVFGVCMGHQCIGQAFGGNVIRAPAGVVHGKMSLVHHTGAGVLAGLPNPFKAARYHSLVIDRDTCPEDLEITAWCEDGTIMGVQHKKYPNIQGVQFHPESIITEDGKRIVQNFVTSLL
jgi:anthranilate synthase component 2